MIEAAFGGSDSLAIGEDQSCARQMTGITCRCDLHHADHFGNIAESGQFSAYGW